MLTITNNTEAVTGIPAITLKARGRRSTFQGPTEQSFPPCQDALLENKNALRHDANDRKGSSNWPCTVSDTLISYPFNEKGGRKSQFKIWSVAKPKEGERHVHTNPPRSRQQSLSWTLSHKRAHVTNTFCQYQQ